MFEKLFVKRTELFKKKDRETWLQVKKALKDAGMTGVHSGHYLQETVMGGGCGAKLDPRDMGPRGRIDREIYWVNVPADRADEAREILRRAGVVAVVEENLAVDAALRKRPQDDKLL